VQFPKTITVTAGGPAFLVFGRAFESGVTSTAGFDPALRAELGVAPDTAPAPNPRTSNAFTFFAATPNPSGANVGGFGNDDEYMASFSPAVPGTFRTAFRFSLDGVAWTYCDADDGNGAVDGGFSAAAAGTITVTPPPP
jgi:hypothetical protein